MSGFREMLGQGSGIVTFRGQRSRCVNHVVAPVSPAAPVGCCLVAGWGSDTGGPELAPLVAPSSRSREEPPSGGRLSDTSRLGMEKEAESEDSRCSSQPSSWSRSWSRPARQRHPNLSP